MDWFSFVAAGILIYITPVVLLSGTVYQIIKERQRCKNMPTNMGGDAPTQLPQPSTQRWTKFLVIALAVTGLGLFLGHTRIFGDVDLILRIFGEDKLNRAGNILGTGLGLFLLVAVGYLLIHRLISFHKEPVTPGALLPLLLVLLVVLLGNYLRLTKPFGLEDYRAYMASLVAFSPAFPEAMATSPFKWVLTSHVLTVNLLLICLPFSGLVSNVYNFVSGQRQRPALSAETPLHHPE